VPPPRETSSGAASTQTAQSELAYPATIVPTKDPASRPDRHPPVRVRSCRLPVHFAPFWSTCRVFLVSLVSHLAIAPGVTGATRRQRCTALNPHPTHATNLPFTGRHRVGGPPKTRRRCRLPPVVAPSERKTPKTRDLHRNRWSITQESRKLDTRGSVTLGAP
jgi:hypothetical protein